MGKGSFNCSFKIIDIQTELLYILSATNKALIEQVR